MIINRIIMKNIRSHSYLDLSFPKSRILLSGDIGAGKSSILYGIEFALFGILKGWNDGDTLLSNDSSKGSVKLYFEIENNKIVIERNLRRTPRGISQGDVLFETEGLQEKIVPTEARSKILELLNYPQEFLNKNPILFRYTVYTPQEKMKEILSDDSEIRMNLLRKLFGLDKYQLIRENSQIVVSNIKNQISYLQGQTRDYLEVEEKHKEVITDIDIIIKKKEELKYKLIEEKKKYEEARKDYSELEGLFIENAQKQSQFKSLKDDINRLSLENNQIIEDINAHKMKQEQDRENIFEKANSLGIEEEEIDIIKTHINKDRLTKNNEKNTIKTLNNERAIKLKLLEEELNEHKNNKNILNERINNTTKKISELKEKEKSNTKIIMENEEKIESTNNITAEESLSIMNAIRKDYFDNKEKISLLNQNIEKEKSDYENIINLSLCPTCKQFVSDEHKRSSINEINLRLNKYTDERKKQIVLTADLKARLESLEQQHSKIEEAKIIKSRNELLRDENKVNEKTMKELNNNIEENKVKLEKEDDNISKKKEAISEIKKIILLDEEKISVLEDLLDNIEELRTLIEIYDSLNNKRILNEQKVVINKKTIQEIDYKINILSQNIKDNEMKLKNFNIIKEQLKKQEETYETILKEHSTIEANYQMLIKRKAEIEDSKKLMSELKTRKEEFVLLKDFFETTIQEITRNIELEKSRSIHSHMESQLSKWFSLLIPDLEVSLNNDFSPIVMQSGFQTKFHNLSGGERTSLSLAYRLALNDTVNHAMLRKHSGLLVLDEPTDGLSTEQLDQVRILLEQVSCEQMIIVSHEQKVESFVDDIIRITKNNN